MAFITKEDHEQIQRTNAIAAIVATMLIMAGVAYMFVITTFIPGWGLVPATYQVVMLVPVICCWSGAIYIAEFKIV